MDERPLKRTDLRGVGACEVRFERIALDVGRHPNRLREVNRRPSASDGDNRLNVGLPLERTQQTRTTFPLAPTTATRILRPYSAEPRLHSLSDPADGTRSRLGRTSRNSWVIPPVRRAFVRF